MKNTHKHSFEDEFRKAFEDAEATPSPKLWAQLDAELANKEAAVYKRKLYIYKLRVAAAAVLVIGFLGVWLVSSQSSGNTLADLPQQTSSQQSSGLAEDRTTPATNARSTVSAPAQSAVAEQRKTAPESATTRSAAENVLANETTRQPQKNNSGNTTGSGEIASLSGEKDSASHPEAIALEANQTKNGSSLNKQAKTKATAPATRPATIGSAKEKAAGEFESAIARNVFSQGKQSVAGQLLTSEKTGEKSITSESKRTNSEPDSPDVTAPLASRVKDGQLHDAFSAYTFSRINQQVQPLDNSIALQAPNVRVKPNNNVWIEEEKEIEGGRSISRWAVGLAFTPSQFNPNMQVNSQASASLSNARNNYYFYSRNTAPVSTGNTLQSNASVGKELESAQNVNLSYNVGLDVGYALSEKFSLHSGLLYLHNSSQITTDNYLQNINNQEKYPEFMALIQPASTQNNLNYSNASNAPMPVSAPMADGFQHLELANADKYASSYPGVTEVMVYNTYQYLSIPLSLHYQLLNKKVSTDIGAGVSADLFMKNTIGNPDENVTSREFNRSNSGPYRDMSFSGLFSAKVNYQISSKYSVYIQPSYRTALNSITNSAFVSSRPNAFGIGTGFQYRF